MEANYTNKILTKIKKNGNNKVFIANDFLKIASYETSKKILNRLTENGEIKKIMSGLYYRPYYSKLLREYEKPNPHEIAVAIARKFNWNIAPEGNTALNFLGLSTQVSAKWTYISDGSYKTFNIENIKIEFKHRNNKEVSGMSINTALIIQALKTLGKSNVNEIVIKKIQNNLTIKDKKKILKEAEKTTIWIYEIIKIICSEV